MRFFVLIALLLSPGVAQADAGVLCSAGAFGQKQCVRPDHYVHDICHAIEAFSKDHGLDPGFFARLIWQESRFDPHALSHANAQGIAQFIPSTAKLRGLRDPYNPAEALEYSAEYLGELTRRYGNHGLAAVAYNGGERRANGLVARTGGLARETINYVKIITGLSAETWRDNPPTKHDFRLSADKPFAAACHDLARKRKLSKYPVVIEGPVRKKWGVQLAFGVSKSRARAMYKASTKRCRGLLRGETPDLIWQKSRSSPKGGYYMARVGRNSRKAAWKLCGKLKSRGCTCAVYRN
jgi:hypothetical protein